MRPRAGFEKWWLWGLLCLIGPFTVDQVRAHLALYHTVEVDLSDAERLEIFIWVHAPELVGATSADIAEEVDRRWLIARSDTELEALAREAERHCREWFSFRCEGRELLTEADLPSPANLRKTAESQTGPGGSLVLRFSATRGPEARTLEVVHREASTKRLLLAVKRSGRFPEAHDLAPGESLRLALSAVADPHPGSPRPRGESGARSGSERWMAIALMIVCVAGGIGLLVRLARRRTGSP